MLLSHTHLSIPFISRKAPSEHFPDPFLKRANISRPPRHWSDLVCCYAVWVRAWSVVTIEDQNPFVHLPNLAVFGQIRFVPPPHAVCLSETKGLPSSALTLTFAKKAWRILCRLLLRALPLISHMFLNILPPPFQSTSLAGFDSD